MSALWLLAAGCGTGSPELPAAPPVELRLDAASVDVPEGEPVEITVHAWTAAGWTLAAVAPAAEGLEVRPQAALPPSQTGGRTHTRWRYDLVGPPGSYVVTLPPAAVTGPAGEAETLSAPPIFVDLGVDGPTGGPLAEIEAAPPPERTPWGWWAAGGVAAAGLLSLALWRARRPPPTPVVLVLSPVEQARRDWARARAESPDDHTLALALSRVLRTLLEARFELPATASTTREILVALESQALLDVAARARAARVLDATDRLKFAREGGGEPFFAALDGDFEAVLDALPAPVLAGSAEVAADA